VCCVYSLVTGVGKWLPKWDFTSLHLASPSATRRPGTVRSTIAIQTFSALRPVALIESTHRAERTNWCRSQPTREFRAIVTTVPRRRLVDTRGTVCYCVRRPKGCAKSRTRVYRLATPILGECLAVLQSPRCLQKNQYCSLLSAANRYLPHASPTCNSAAHIC
jgi:hypothetical protein